MIRNAIGALLLACTLGVSLAPTAAAAQPDGDWYEQCFGDEIGIPDPNAVCQKIDGKWTRVDGGDPVSSMFGTFVFFAILLSLVPAAAGAMVAKEADVAPGVGFAIGLFGSWVGVIGLYLYGHSRRSGSPVIQVGPPVGAKPAPEPAGAAERLKTLKDLLDQGLITQAEYDRRRAATIDSL